MPAAGTRAADTNEPPAPDAPEPELTVVIPVWDDYVQTVGEAVSSVLAQPVRCDVIVVDNASSQPLPSLPPAVTTVRLPVRVSAGAARNAGLLRISSELVLFLDADDLVLAGTLELLLGRMRARPALTACARGVLGWNAATGRRRPLDFPSGQTRLLSRWPRAYAVYAAFGNRMPTTGCVVMRTAAAVEAGGFADGDFAEDWPLNAGLAFRGPIEFLPGHGRLLRVHATSLRARPRARAEVAAAFERTRERFRADPAAPAAVRLGLSLLALHHCRQVRRATPGEISVPGPALLALGDGGLAPARPGP